MYQLHVSRRDNMTEVKKYLTNNECYIKNVRITAVHGVMIHSTACPGVDADTFATSWNTFRPNGKQVCVHAFADDKKVINTLPYNVRSWGCGGYGNDIYIQIELCEFRNKLSGESDGDYTLARQVYMDKLIKNVVKFTVDRLQEHEINEVTHLTVTSHYEAHAKGWASNHADPRPMLALVGLSMDSIRTLCANEMSARKGHASNEQVSQTGTPVIVSKDGCPFTVKLTTNTTPIYKEPNDKSEKVRDIIGFGVYTIVEVSGNYGKLKSGLGWIKISDNDEKIDPYLVKVTVGELNIRSGPGTAHQIVGVIRDYGVYTIIEQAGDWGRLKSKVGWIHLGSVRKI